MEELLIALLCTASTAYLLDHGLDHLEVLGLSGETCTEQIMLSLTIMSLVDKSGFRGGLGSQRSSSPNTLEVTHNSDLKSHSITIFDFSAAILPLYANLRKTHPVSSLHTPFLLISLAD